MNPAFTLFMWARGPAFDVALAIFAAGITLRLVEMVVLGRKTDLAPAKGHPIRQGLATIFTRSIPRPGLVRFAPGTYLGGYVFHLGFFAAFLLFAPHIALIRDALGLSWPAANRAIVESATALAVVAAIILFFSRVMDPVRRALTGFEDYLVLLLSVLPLVTGYVAANKLFGNPEMMLAVHVLSVDALLIVFPFTKLMHSVSFVFSRYYNGAIQGRKGAES